MAMAVVAILLALATTDMSRLHDRRRLEAAAAQLETDLMATRSLAVARDRGVRLGFESTPLFSCYVIHAGGPDDCHCTGDATAICRPGVESWRTVMFDAAGPVFLRSNVRSILFDGTKGTSTPAGTLRLIGRDGSAIHQVINIMGRVRSCSPPLPGVGPVPGYARC
jgi:type IV fimbrial biogenesis protein FimT